MQEKTINATKKQKHEVSSVELRIMSLNVHGFSDPARTMIIDNDIYALVRDFKPDVCCFQEVKHPFPAFPDNGNYVVRINKDRKQLLRYHGYDTDEQLRNRLCMDKQTELRIAQKQETSDLGSFLFNDKFRRSKRYLEKIFDTNNAASLRDDELNKDTVLDMTISQLNRTNEMKYSFSPALDETFGTAIIADQKIIDDTLKYQKLTIDEYTEVRVATSLT